MAKYKEQTQGKKGQASSSSPSPPENAVQDAPPEVEEQKAPPEAEDQENPPESEEQEDQSEDHFPQEAVPGRMLDVKQVAYRLSISPRSVYRLIAMGELPVAKIGPVYGYRLDESDVCDYYERVYGKKDEG